MKFNLGENNDVRQIMTIENVQTNAKRSWNDTQSANVIRALLLLFVHSMHTTNLMLCLLSLKMLILRQCRKRKMPDRKMLMIFLVQYNICKLIQSGHKIISKVHICH